MKGNEAPSRYAWFISGDERLKASTVSAIRAPENAVYLSVVSLWEAIIKHQLGKLPLPQAPEVYLPEQRERHLISSLPIHEESVARLAKLPSLHRDPFDRLMICQALQNSLTLVTVDKAVLAYPQIRTLPA